MVLSTKYQVVLSYSGATSSFLFDSMLKVKEFLSHLSANLQLLIRVYQNVYKLNTTTHLLEITTTELTSW